MLRSERDERETVRATILFEIVASRFIKPFLPFPLFLLFENWILLKRYAFYISFHFLGQNSRISSGNHNLRLILSSLIKNIILVQLCSREERKVTFFLSGKNRGKRNRRGGKKLKRQLVPLPTKCTRDVRAESLAAKGRRIYPWMKSKKSAVRRLPPPSRLAFAFTTLPLLFRACAEQGRERKRERGDVSLCLPG